MELVEETTPATVCWRCSSPAARQGTNPEPEALDLRTGLMEAGGCTFTAAVTADWAVASIPSPWIAPWISRRNHPHCGGAGGHPRHHGQRVPGRRTVEFDGAALDFALWPGATWRPWHFRGIWGSASRAVPSQPPGRTAPWKRSPISVGYGEEAMTFEVCWTKEVFRCTVKCSTTAPAAWTRTSPDFNGNRNIAHRPLRGRVDQRSTPRLLKNPAED